MLINNFLPFLRQSTNEIEKSINTREYWTLLYYEQLSNIILGVFDYKSEKINKINRERINKSLFYYNYVGCIFDKNYGVLISPVTPQGKADMFNNYTDFKIDLLENSKTYQIDKDIIVCRNLDNTMITDNMLCYLFAEQLAELKISILNATILSRYSANVVTDNENSIREKKSIFDDFQIGKINFFTKKRIDENIGTLNFVPPEKLTEYYNGRREIINEFLETTGLSSLVNPNKKERLLTEEISSNDDIKSTLLLNKINNRIDFVNSINKKFDLDIKLVIADVINIDTLYNELI